MNALSLFSGVGGIDLAAEAAGIRTAAMCERDPFCRAVLKSTGRTFRYTLLQMNKVSGIEGSD
jgi:site-specific DNA-cytosine methylase